MNEVLHRSLYTSTTLLVYSYGDVQVMRRDGHMALKHIIPWLNSSRKLFWPVVVSSVDTLATSSEDESSIVECESYLPRLLNTVGYG